MQKNKNDNSFAETCALKTSLREKIGTLNPSVTYKKMKNFGNHMLIVSVTFVNSLDQFINETVIANDSSFSFFSAKRKEKKTSV